MNDAMKCPSDQEILDNLKNAGIENMKQGIAMIYEAAAEMPLENKNSNGFGDMVKNSAYQAKDLKK